MKILLIVNGKALMTSESNWSETIEALRSKLRRIFDP